MNILKSLFKYSLCICVLSLAYLSAAAQCFTSYTLSPSGNVCGTSANMTLSGSQYTVNYQLQFNGVNVGNVVSGTGASINFGNVTSGGIYQVVATKSGSCGSATIASVGVQFIPVPAGNVTASNTIACPAGPVIYTVNPSVSGAYNYQWLLNGAAISGATAQTYSTATAGTYTVQMSNSCSTATLSCPAITILPSAGQPGAITGPQTRIAGNSGSSTYSISAVSGASAYSWSLSPVTAGTFTGSGTSVTFNWNPDFSGTAIIGVKSSNGCSALSIASLLPVSVDLPASSAYSYVTETDLRVSNITTSAAISPLPLGQKTITTTYQDQTGRTLETVMQGASPGGSDLVQPMAYDPAGRKVTDYLPYTVPGVSNGSYKSNPIASQAAYYNPASPGASNIATSTNSTSQTSFDNSPLERVVEKGYPGTTWIQGGGHTVQNSYGTNPGYLSMWVLTSGGSGANTLRYSPGTLFVNTVTDENSNAVIQYTDFSGKMLAKAVQSGPTTYLYTYYVYDDAGNLCYVIPPMPTLPTVVGLPSSFIETDAIFTNFFYGYHYDGKNRLTEKKVPGKGWEYYVYNKLDQVILSQTPTQLALGIWMYNKYDSRGRLIMTGDFTSSSTRTTLQDAIDTFTGPQWESFTNAATNYGYTDVSYPSSSYSSQKKTLSASFYDTYAFLSNSSINTVPTVFALPPVLDTLLSTPSGLLTGSVSNVLGAAATTYLLSMNYYDTYGRTVQTITQSFKSGNAGAGNYDIVQNQYSFTNLLVKSIRYHYLSAALQLTINTFYGYDAMGRKILLQQQYNTGPLVNLAEYDYNELGQLYRKSLHAPGQPVGVPSGTDITLSSAINSGNQKVYASHSITLMANPSPGTNFSVASGATFQASIVQPYLQTINYSYNIRGWLTKINDPNNFGTNTLFAEQIDYDQPNTGFSGTTPQYNGNISTVSWQTLAKPSIPMVQEVKGYVFNYDNLNRLTAAYFKAPSGNDKYNEAVSYDELGNILSLNRNATATTYVNKLTYDYGSGTQRGNQLLDVQDNGGTDTYTSTFSYLPSGDETANTKTGVLNITYNELNLPSLVTFTGGKTINFMYSAAGEEYERVIKQNATISEDRSYIHGIEYTSAGIDFIHTDEGRARPNAGGFLLEYQLTDHLGNVRAMFGDEDGNGTFTASDIVQTIDYYAFGRQIAYLESNPLSQYKYNGKEYSADLNEYNYGARYYNPVTARWNAIDNDAEKSRRWNPYTYALNNPVRNIDVDGNDYTWYANEESNIMTIPRQVYDAGLQAAGWDEMDTEYEEGEISSPAPRPIVIRETDAEREFAYNMASFSGGSSGGSGADGSGLLNDVVGALANFTPFGGAIQFAKAAQNGDIGSALAGIASSAAFFTGDGEIGGLAETGVSDLSGSAGFSPSAIARSWQGSGDYPGVDNWSDITLSQGSYIAGGLPGQSKFYTTMDGLLQSGLSKDALWQGLQVANNGFFPPRPTVGIYGVTSDTPGAFSFATENKGYGVGGLPQLFLPDYSNLNLLYTIPLK